jgi:riboflavin synthase
MFTGLVSDVGRVAKITRDQSGAIMVIETAYDANTIDIGASIALSGACHTVTEKRPGSVSFYSSNETLARTTVGDWTEGTRVNLERSLTLGQELGGHIVSGHVDGVGEVQDVIQDGDAWRIKFSAPKPLLRFIAEKGSIAVDGVSLTVNGANNDGFHVAIIPHTMEHTTFSDLKVGSRVNLEIDMLARYVKRLLETEDLT